MAPHRRYLGKGRCQGQSRHLNPGFSGMRRLKRPEILAVFWSSRMPFGGVGARYSHLGSKWWRVKRAPAALKENPPTRFPGFCLAAGTQLSTCVATDGPACFAVHDSRLTPSRSDGNAAGRTEPFIEPMACTGVLQRYEPPPRTRLGSRPATRICDGACQTWTFAVPASPRLHTLPCSSALLPSCRDSHLLNCVAEYEFQLSKFS